jgi:hypothetical protein
MEPQARLAPAYGRKWVDPDGHSGNVAESIQGPARAKLVKSAGAKWERLVINKPSYVWTTDRRVIRFYPGIDPGDLSAASELSRWFSSVNSVAFLRAPGEWWIGTPLLAGEADGDLMTCLYADATMGGESPLDPNLIVGENMVTQVGPPSFVNAPAADTLLVAARPGRRSLSLWNRHSVPVWLGWGQTAIVRKGDMIPPQVSGVPGRIFWTSTQAVPVPETSLRGITDDGSALANGIAFQEMF